MSYEKYIKKDGKLYGPYLYESKRVDGKVISEYHGQKKLNYAKFLWAIPLVFLILLGAYLIGQRGDKLTGHAILDLNANYQEGKTLEGGLKVALKSGELIPASSVVVFENGGNKYEYGLNEVISEPTTQGNFFVAGKTLTGSGDGFGISGIKEIYPEVKFTLIISSEENVEETTATETTPVEETSTGPLNVIANFFLSLTPTGNAVLEFQKEISGTTSAGNPFTYTLQDRERAEIKPLSVMTGSNQLSENDINLITEGNLVTISTTYSEKEEGFGSDYSGENIKEFTINLDKLNLFLEKGDFNIGIFYNNEELVSMQTTLGSGEIVSESETILESDVSDILNEPPTENIPVINKMLELTSEEKNILINEFGSISVNTTSAKTKNGFIIIRYEIGGYWIENSYDAGLDNSTLSSFMEADRIKFLKDIAQKLSSQLKSEKEIPELLKNYPY